MTAHRLGLSLAINDYDHVRDIVDGTVPVEGVELTCLQYSVEEIFFRFTQHREWDVSELSFAKFTALRAAGADVVGIPVFPSRVFRHSAFYVRADSELQTFDDLRGKRVGQAEWTVTATVVARGLLADAGVATHEVSWVQAGLEAPGRIEGMEFVLPEGVSYESFPTRTLSEMLLGGDIDAIISPRAPSGLADGRMRRLLADPLSAERDFYQRTSVFPIMHVIAMRASVHETHPWVAMNLMTAFEEAKQRSLARMADFTCSRIPIPWSANMAAEAVDVFGPDPWPYGVDANRPSLEAFLRYASDQGLTQRKLEIEDLFVPEVLSAYRL